MTDIGNLDSTDGLYANYIKEIENIEKTIETHEKKIKELKNELSYYKNKYNEMGMISPKKSVQSSKSFINTKRIDQIQKAFDLCHEELEKGNDNGIKPLLSMKEKNDIQPASEVLAVNENDRKRIARDLHDYTIQDIIYLIHKVEIASKYIDQDPVRAKLELSTITKSLKSTIHNLRNMVYDLHPMTFDDLGFEDTLNNFVDYISNTSEMVVSFENNADLDKYNELILINLFRIIQECCNNAIKHSKGTRIDIKILEDENHIILVVQDDGVGFKDTESEEDSSNHFGIKIIKDRVFLLSGTCDFYSDNTGTKITVKIANF